MNEAPANDSPPAAAEPDVPELDVVAAVDPTAVQHPPPDVGRRAAGGVVWLTAQKWAIRIFGFVTIALLTRLLEPADFGTLAAASTVLPFFYLLADLGFAAYIVQVPKTTERMLSTAFWFSMSAGVLLCGVLWLSAPLLGGVFGNPQVTPVLRALSIWVVITAVGSVPTALMRREMRFAALAAQGAAAAGIAQVVALVMAFNGFGVWALVGQTLTAPVVATTLIWITVRWRPRRAFSRSDFTSMSKFGGKVLGVEFVAMMRAWGEAAVTSSVLGPAALGFMNVAQRLVQIVQDLTGSAIVPVTNVAFARIRKTPARLQSAYLRALWMVYLVLALPLTVVAVAAPLIVPIVFGSGWAASIPVAQILALAGTLSVAAWLDHGLFYAIGKPGTWFVYALIVDAITFTTTVVTAHWGLVAIAWGFLGVATLATFARWFLIRRSLGIGLRGVVRPFLFVVVTLVVAGGVGLLGMRLTAGLPSLVALVLVAGLITLAHVGVSLLLARPAARDLVSMAAHSRLGDRLPWLARIAGAL